MPTAPLARRVLDTTIGPARGRRYVRGVARRLHRLYPDPPARKVSTVTAPPPKPRPVEVAAPEATIDPAARRINIGGGMWSHPGWENVDHYVTGPEVQYSQDLRLNQRLPLDDGTCRLLFTSHILEHMDDPAAAAVLREARRLLAPGGPLRVSVPDARRAVEAYHAGDELFFTKGGVTCVGDTLERRLVNFFASYRHEGYTGGPLVEPADVRAALADLELAGFIAWCVDRIPAQAGYKAHVNGYDFPKLAGLLRGAGFETVTRSAWRGSRVPEMRHENFDNRPVVSLFVEAYCG